MIKKASLLALFLCLLSFWLSPVSALARGEPAVLDSSVRTEFPSHLEFNLSAAGDVEITDIRLHYRVDRESFARVTSEVYIEFVPDTSVEVSWTWDMRRSGGLPPRADIEYWWTIRDTEGNEVITAPQPVAFDDQRYSWRSLSEGRVTINWYKGSESFAGELMAEAQRALRRLAGDTGARLERPVDIYIYASYQDLRGSMIYPQEWTGGVAFTRYGTIAIGIAPDNLDWGRRAMAHELAHLVIHQMTLNPYSGLPVWLDEGLAMYAEGPLELSAADYLDKMAAEGELITVRSLSSPFSAFAEEASLAYAQSYSLVDFLIASYGQEKMLALLHTFRQGSSYDGALRQVYGFDMDDLDTLWRDYIAAPAAQEGEAGLQPEKIGLPVGLGTALLLALGLAASRWAWGRG